MNVRIFWVRAMKCMCAQTRPRFILSSEGVFGGMEFEPMLTPREKSPLPEKVPRGGSNPRRCGQRAQALPTELFQPPFFFLLFFVVSVCVCVCVCVCVWERERERECVCVCVCETVSEWVNDCVCACEHACDEITYEGLFLLNIDQTKYNEHEVYYTNMSQQYTKFHIIHSELWAINGT